MMSEKCHQARYRMAIMAAVKIGRRVRSERVKRFTTQERLAAAAGISSRQLVRIERNEVDPRFSTILKLAEALEVEPSELVETEE
jgi:transcriptional regulator with XRE-family HTH domain